MTTDASAQLPAHRFGTFLGVFTPSVLTILGLIMYLRFGWVVGNVGLAFTFLIVLLASSITFITALSASAVATNMSVGVGGEYYLISRSLGLELGGAIGIPLFLCRTLSITFYSFGLAESILTFWPASWGPIPGATTQLLTAGLIVAIVAISGKSAEVALKLGEYRKLSPGPIEEWIFYDHPSGRSRIHMAMTWKAENMTEEDGASALE